MVEMLRIVGGNKLTMKSGAGIGNDGCRSMVDREMASASVEREISEQSSSHGEGFSLGFLDERREIEIERNCINKYCIFKLNKLIL